MIEKNLFIMWFGQNQPAKIYESLNAYKEKNPDFNIQYIYEPDMINVFDLSVIKNTDLKECLSYVHSDKDNIYKQLFNRKEAQWIRHGSNPVHADFSLLGDAFKVFLLNKYGGICVDVDTQPVTAFDDMFLDYELVMPQTWSYDRSYSYTDFFILGMQKNYIADKQFVSLNHIWQLHQKTRKCLMLKPIDKKDNANEYIIHYFDNNWK